MNQSPLTLYEGLEYLVLVIGLAGPCEQFYILPRPRPAMVWAGLILFTAQLVKMRYQRKSR